MDRHSRPSGKITVKLNGDVKKTNETLKIYDWQDARKEMSATKDYESNRSRPFSLKKPAYQKPHYKRRPLRLRKRSFPLLKARKKEPVSGWLLAIISAIIVGILIGVLLLKVMVKSSSEQEGEEVITEMPVQSEQVLLPGADFVFLQQGVYENEASFQELLAQSELPLTYVQVDGRYHVFAGVAPSLDLAKAMQQESDYENMFPKALTTNEKVLSSITATEKQFIDRVFPFYLQLLEAASLIFLESENQAVNLDEIEKTYRELSEIEVEAKQLNDLKTSLDEAYESLKQYVESKAREDWLHVQNHLLQFATDYYNL